jgi:hypothetical protein
MLTWLIAQLGGKLLPRIVIVLAVLGLLALGAPRGVVQPLLELLYVKESPQQLDPLVVPLQSEHTRAVNTSISED